MKKYFSFLLVAALFAACTPNNEIGTPFKAGQEVTLSAQMPNAGNNGAQQLPGKQRVSGKDTGTKIDLTWDKGDVILVKVGDKTAEFTLQSGAGTAQAEFKGIMPADGTNFSVQYPVEEPDLSNQIYVENGFGKGLMKMTTETNGTIDGGFTLAPQHTLLGLQLKGSDDLSKIVLTNPADSKTYTLTCTDVTLTEDASTLFYIVIPKGEWPSGFKVEVYAADNSTILNTFEKTGSVSFGADAVAMPEQDVNIKSFTANGVSFRMIAVKGGTFTMGATQKQLDFQMNELGMEDYELSKQDQPAHQVTLTYNYHIGETEVTQELWEAVMGTNPSRFNGDDYKQHPVDSVSWDNCQEFVTELNQLLADQLNGRTFRLPTNAEWEYAARGGHKMGQEYIFAGSDIANEVAWYSIKNEQNLEYSQPVKGKMPNELELYDMSGNVEEWCQDHYYTYTSAPETDPIGYESEDYIYRVVRGGRWQINSGDGSRFCRVGYRNQFNHENRHDYVGLRLALVENK